MDEAMGQLACGAFFFGMRSCEYLVVAGEKRKTKRLKIRNIRFFKNNIEIRDKTSALILFADTVIQYSSYLNSRKINRRILLSRNQGQEKYLSRHHMG